MCLQAFVTAIASAESIERTRNNQSVLG